MERTEIILGQKFGDWTVIDSTPIYKRGGQRYVKVQCKCGKVEYKHWSSLRLGKTTCCLSCSRKQRRLDVKVGDKFKEWTVIGDPEPDKFGILKYKVQCSCGHIQRMSATALHSQTRWFRCKHCSDLKNVDDYTLKNGKIGELSLSRFNNIKYKAELRHLEFTVTIEYLWRLFLAQNKKCAITGDNIEHLKDASLDRINSNVGYVEGNVQWTTKQANICKHKLSMTELYEFCNKVINHANQQPSIPLTKDEGSETNS